jgi:EF-hand domain-containing family member B
VYGCPTVRNDIAVPRRRSVADPQNYGDELPGKDLIHPHTLAGSVTVEEEELDIVRPKGKIRSLFASIGYALDDAVFDRLFERAACEPGYATIAAFRGVLNDYLEE